MLLVDMRVVIPFLLFALAIAAGSNVTTPTGDSGLILVYEVDCDVSASSTSDCPQHDLSVTRIASTGASSEDWPGSYIAVVVLLFLLVLVLMGLVIAVYLRQQQGYSQVDPAAGEYSQVYNAEAGRTRKTIGVAMVRALPAEA